MKQLKIEWKDNNVQTKSHKWKLFRIYNIHIAVELTAGTQLATIDLKEKLFLLDFGPELSLFCVINKPTVSYRRHQLFRQHWYNNKCWRQHWHLLLQIQLSRTQVEVNSSFDLPPWEKTFPHPPYLLSRRHSLSLHPCQQLRYCWTVMCLLWTQGKEGTLGRTRYWKYSAPHSISRFRITVELTRGDNWIIRHLILLVAICYIVIIKENSIKSSMSKEVCPSSRLHVILSNLV